MKKIILILFILINSFTLFSQDSINQPTGTLDWRTATISELISPFYTQNVTQPNASLNTLRTRKMSFNYSGVSDVLSEEVSFGQNYIILLTDENITSYIIGEYVCIKNSRSELIEIKDIDGRTLELSWAIQNNYDTTHTVINPKTTNMCQADITDNASFENPVVFKLEAGKKEKFHISRIMIAGSDNSSMNYEEFLGFTALTNGCVLGYRHIDPLYETTHNHYIAHIHNNGDWVSLMYDVLFVERISGVYGLQGRFTLTKFSGGIDINGSLSEYILFNIRDNIEAGTNLEISVQGWVEFLD